MKNRSILACAVISAMICTGCSHAPGRPGPHSEVIPPSEVKDFKLLYSENCVHVMATKATEERRFLSAIPSSSQLPTMLRFAGRLSMA